MIYSDLMLIIERIRGQKRQTSTLSVKMNFHFVPYFRTGKYELSKLNVYVLERYLFQELFAKGIKFISIKHFKIHLNIYSNFDFLQCPIDVNSRPQNAMTSFEVGFIIRRQIQRRFLSS